MSTSRPAKHVQEPQQASAQKTRSALIAAVLAQTRELGTRESLYGQAVADQLGMNQTDLECGDLLAYYGPMTAGRLAELVGLTTGAITGVIDRLERAGMVRRERDANDRRRVIVHAQPGADPLGEPTYAARKEALAEVAEQYSDEDLAVIVRRAAKGVSQAVKQTKTEAKQSAKQVKQSAKDSLRRR